MFDHRAISRLLPVYKYLAYLFAGSKKKLQDRINYSCFGWGNSYDETEGRRPPQASFLKKGH
ncbi:hypothetical protein TUM17564_44010 [Citrobacter freundii]|nr:hypothetical protein TUM17564_44010 [Citrobacter freundii]